ncbi:hemerythrin domain-containing protein [Hydrogenophaga sp.]|uniref:hemerythrin domain-containing protein n=1 Tax=Hydrogenophaga sp. TaxID=1904254 RepID=UPI0027252688|nr:hemerythrin domain-containing protein [Hydrogenophaga sp.]MDO8906756.1 hemerythrin domain-containing protein [Hydrogenophaga sp.]
MRCISVARLRDGLDQLHGEHRSIKQLLRAFERARALGTRGYGEKAAIVDSLCDTLTLHARLEEEIFYPLVRSVIPQDTDASAAFCNHKRLLDLISWLDELEPDHPDYDRLVRLIGDCVLPSMDQEQAVLFEAARSAGLDTLALGQRMAMYRKTHRRDLTLVEVPERMA